MTERKQEIEKRIYADPPSSPIFAIKTNLDPENITEENPYAPHKRDKKFEQYFKHS